MSSSSSTFSTVKDRLKHLPGTKFHIHDILGIQASPFASETTFNLIILKTLSATTAKMSVIVARLRAFATPDAMIAIVQSNNLTGVPDSSLDESNITASWENGDTEVFSEQMG